MWYVMQVMSGQEHKIAGLCRKHMLLDGEEVFVPMYEREKKIKGEWKRSQAVLFPGYVFISTEQIENVFLRLKKITELSKILMTGDTFTPLHQDEEAFIRRFGGKEHIVGMSAGFIEGNEVVITSGPMSGWTGNIRKINRHKRTAVLEMEFFGRITEVTVGLEIVEKK